MRSRRRAGFCGPLERLHCVGTVKSSILPLDNILHSLFTQDPHQQKSRVEMEGPLILASGRKRRDSSASNRQALSGALYSLFSHFVNLFLHLIKYKLVGAWIFQLTTESTRAL